MTRYAIITDIHYGARNNNINFYNYQRNFFFNVFFPYLKKEKINKIFFLGDLVDNRTNVSHLTYRHLNEDFLEPLRDFDVEMIVGNHDCYYKSTNNLNFLREYVAKNYDFTIHDQEANESSLGGSKFLMVPWINPQNKYQIMKAIEESTAEYCLGHFEIIGAEMSKGRYSNVGINKENFERFRLVLSGHYHNRSVISKIRYVGNPFTFNWDDYNYGRGFSILDDETKKLKFIKNPYEIYKVFEYDEDAPPTDLQTATGTYCRVYIKNKTSETKFNDFMSRLNEFGPIESTIIENPQAVTILENKEIVIDDTRKIFRNYLDETLVPNKDGVWNLFERVYEKANQK